MLKKYRTEIIVLYVFAAAAMVVASFFDLKIDIALNDPSNPFAVWLYRTGEFPSRLICPIAGAVIFRCTDKKAVAAIGAALCLGGSAVSRLFTPFGLSRFPMNSKDLFLRQPLSASAL